MTTTKSLVSCWRWEFSQELSRQLRKRHWQDFMFLLLCELNERWWVVRSKSNWPHVLSSAQCWLQNLIRVTLLGYSLELAPILRNFRGVVQYFQLLTGFQSNTKLIGFTVLICHCCCVLFEFKTFSYLGSTKNEGFEIVSLRAEFFVKDIIKMNQGK